MALSRDDILNAIADMSVMDVVELVSFQGGPSPKARRLGIAFIYQSASPLDCTPLPVASQRRNWNSHSTVQSSTCSF